MEASETASSSPSPRVLVYGNRHRLVEKKKKKGEKEETTNKHEWTAFVEAKGDAWGTDPIKQVTFELHPTFHPPVITCTQPPFHVTRRGWGTFEVKIAVEFTSGEPPLGLKHVLSFRNDGETHEITLPSIRTNADQKLKEKKKPKEKKKKGHTVPSDILQKVICSKSGSRDEIVNEYLAPESINQTFSGEAHDELTSLRYVCKEVTLLHVAVVLADSALVETLLRAGASPNAVGGSLERCYERRSSRKDGLCYDFFESHRSNALQASGATPLHLAFLLKKYELAVRLLQADANPWLIAPRLKKSSGSHCSSKSIDYVDVTAFHMAMYQAPETQENVWRGEHQVDNSKEAQAKRMKVAKELYMLLLRTQSRAGSNVNELAGSVSSSTSRMSPDNGSSSGVTVEGATPLVLRLISLGCSQSSSLQRHLFDDLLAIGCDPSIICKSYKTGSNYDGHAGSGGGNTEITDFTCVHLAIHWSQIDIAAAMLKRGSTIDKTHPMKIVKIKQPHRAMFDDCDDLFDDDDDGNVPSRRRGRGKARPKADIKTKLLTLSELVSMSGDTNLNRLLREL